MRRQLLNGYSDNYYPGNKESRVINMAKLFDYDNPIWRFMGKVTDMFFLTVLWAVFSLPVVTIGASTTALYYVSLKMAKNNEGYIWQSFWRAFKENFRQSTWIWLIMLAFGLFFAGDLYCYYQMDSRAAVFIFWLFAVLAVLYLFMLTMIFPLAARLDTGLKNIFFMSFMVSLKNFSWVLLMLVAALCILALGVFVFWPALLLGAGAAAYIHAKILVLIIFPKYNWNEEG